MAVSAPSRNSNELRVYFHWVSITLAEEPKKHMKNKDAEQNATGESSGYQTLQPPPSI